MLNTILQDLRYSLRLMRRHPAFAIVAISTIAIGISANTTVFSLVSAMLVQPPDHVRDPERLFVLYLDESSTPEVDYRGISYPQYDALKRNQDVFTELSFQMRSSPLVTFGDETEPTVLDGVTGNYFAVQGIFLIAGPLEPQPDLRASNPSVARHGAGTIPGPN
jgi:hypothetical protein